MPRLTEREQQEIIRYLEADKPLPDKFRFLLFEEKEAAFVDLILRAYRAEKITGFAAFHGKKAGRLVAVGPVNLPVTRLFVEEIIRVRKENSRRDAPAIGGTQDMAEAQSENEHIEYEEVWTGDYIFENEWQVFRTKKDRSIEMKSVFHECKPGRRKIAVKVVDIFGNDTMTILEVRV